MSYRRFKISDLGLGPATLANLATVQAELPKTVADVASVAVTNGENTPSADESVAELASVAGGYAETAFFAPDPAGTWDDEDWQVAFEERAAIFEYDGGWSREAAEQFAHQWIEEQRAIKRSTQ